MNQPAIPSLNLRAPHLHSLPPLNASAAQACLKAYRQRLAQSTWGRQTPATLFAPVWSEAAEIHEFERSLNALHRALLKVLLQEQQIRQGQRPRHALAELFEFVRRCNNWPVLGLGAELPLSQMLANNPAQYLYGRPDIVLSEDGPKLVETNFDTGIGGFLGPDEIWHIAAELFDLAPELLSWGSPLQGFAAYFTQRCGEQPSVIHWIMKDMPEIRQELEPALARLQAASAPHIRHALHYAGRALAASFEPAAQHYLHRACSVYTVQSEVAAFTDLLQQLWPKTQQETVPVALSLLNSKLLLAWLSDPRYRPDNLSLEEFSAIEDLLPWTRVLALLDAQQVTRILAQQSDYVIKKSDSFEARDVHLGWTKSANEWQQLVSELRHRPGWDGLSSDIWIVQKRVRARPQRLIEYTDQGVQLRQTGVSCGPYILGGKIRGLESWITALNPDLSMLHTRQLIPHYIRGQASC